MVLFLDFHGCGDPKDIAADIRLGNSSSAALVLGVSKSSVCAKRFMEHFTGFSLSARADIFCFVGPS